MKIVLIGTGNCILDPQRGMFCIALESKSGIHIVDSGSGAIQGCVEEGFALSEIKSTFITHFHVDHVLDIVQLLWLRGIHSKNIFSPLTIYGPKGLKNFICSLQISFPSASIEDAKAIVEEVIPDKKFAVDEMEIQPFKTLHTEESIGYIFKFNQKKFIISGDCGYSEGLVSACRNADVAILECSYDNSPPVQTHMGPMQCATVGAEAGIKKLVLTHLPAGISEENITRAVKEKFNGEIVIAHDFMEIEI